MTQENPYQVIDMESYALAGVCHAHNLPFAAFKYISDGTNETSSKDWLDSVNAAEKMLEEKVLAWIGY
jgi:adenosylhomocysteine nucleosidase